MHLLNPKQKQMAITMRFISAPQHASWNRKCVRQYATLGGRHY